MVSAQYGGFIVTNFITFVLSKFKTNLLAENHSIMHANTWFADVEKSIKLSLEIITLVSSANNIDSDREFICNGRIFI